MTKLNHATSVCFAIALYLSVPLPAASAAEEPKPDRATQQPVAEASETPAVKVGVEREMVFKEVPPESDASKQPLPEYTAIFDLFFRAPESSGSPSSPIRSVSIPKWGRRAPEIAVLESEIFPRSGGREGAAWLLAMAANTDESLRPSKELVDRICASTSMDVQWIEPSQPPSPGAVAQKGLAIRISIRDEDRARLDAMVRALLLLVDEGFSPKFHQMYLASLKTVEAYVKEQKSSLAELEKNREQMQKEMEELSSVKEMSQEALATLVAHKHMLAVKRAGIQARLEACKKILAISQNEQVESAKIAAEIELVGIVAEEQTVDGIIQSGRRRMLLSKQDAHVYGSVRRTESELESDEKLLPSYEKAVAEMWAHPRVSEVLISNAPGPIKAKPLPNGEKEWWEN